MKKLVYTIVLAAGFQLAHAQNFNMVEAGAPMKQNFSLENLKVVADPLQADFSFFKQQKAIDTFYFLCGIGIMTKTCTQQLWNYQYYTVDSVSNDTTFYGAGSVGARQLFDGIGMLLPYNSWLGATGKIDSVEAYMFSIGPRTGTSVATIYELDGTPKGVSNPVNLVDIFDGVGTTVNSTVFRFNPPIEMTDDILVLISVTSSDPDDGIVLYTTENGCTQYDFLLGIVDDQILSLKSGLGLIAEGHIYVVGTFIYDDGTTLVAESSMESVKLYPNPVRNQLKIENLSEATDISIYSITGQMLQSVSSVVGSVEIDVNNLSNGMYFIKMQNGNSVRTEKIQILK